MKKLLSLLLSFLLGCVFILSAYAKLWPIEPFEYNIVGTTIIGWKLSVIIARLIIALEFLLGFLLLFSYNHKLNIPAAIGLLLVFTFHLTYQLVITGNNVDCGCFGNFFKMTPLQGILKNIILISLLLLLYKLDYSFKTRIKNMELYAFLVSLTCIFIVNPVDFNYSSGYLDKKFDNYPLEIDTIYNSMGQENIEMPLLDIRKGKFIVAFLSASCNHCKIAAGKIGVMKSENSQIPFYLFINGKNESIAEFIRTYNIQNIPHSRLNGSLFIELAGLQLPVFYYLHNSFVERQLDYFTLDQSHIEAWLNEDMHN